jgi:hypothetical protein
VLVWACELGWKLEEMKGTEWGPKWGLGLASWLGGELGALWGVKLGVALEKWLERQLGEVKV